MIMFKTCLLYIIAYLVLQTDRSYLSGLSHLHVEVGYDLIVSIADCFIQQLQIEHSTIEERRPAAVD